MVALGITLGICAAVTAFTTLAIITTLLIIERPRDRLSRDTF
jgi:hypothetical protein